MLRHLLPAALALLLLAAHFSRAGSTFVVIALIAAIGLLFVRRPWASYALQAILGLGVIVWLLTLWGIAEFRIANQEPWLRMAFIMGAVAVFTGYASWHFRHHHVRAWFGTDSGGAAPDNGTPTGPKHEPASAVNAE